MSLCWFGAGALAVQWKFRTARKGGPMICTGTWAIAVALRTVCLTSITFRLKKFLGETTEMYTKPFYWIQQ